MTIKKRIIVSQEQELVKKVESKLLEVATDFGKEIK